MAEVAGSKGGRIVAELPQRTHDLAGQHPGDTERQQERHESEQHAHAQAPNHGGKRDIRRQTDRDHPRHQVGPRRTGDALDIVRPADHFAEIAGCEMPGDSGRIAEIATDPVRAVGAVRDHDQVLVDDANDAAARKLRECEGILETLKPRADREDGAQAAIGVDDRTCDRDDPFVARTRSDDGADGMVVSGDDLHEVVAIAGKNSPGIG